MTRTAHHKQYINEHLIIQTTAYINIYREPSINLLQQTLKKRQLKTAHYLGGFGARVFGRPKHRVMQQQHNNYTFAPARAA